MAKEHETCTLSRVPSQFKSIDNYCKEKSCYLKPYMDIWIVRDDKITIAEDYCESSCAQLS